MLEHQPVSIKPAVQSSDDQTQTGRKSDRYRERRTTRLSPALFSDCPLHACALGQHLPDTTKPNRVPESVCVIGNHGRGVSRYQGVCAGRSIERPYAYSRAWVRRRSPSDCWSTLPVLLRRFACLSGRSTNPRYTPLAKADGSPARKARTAGSQRARGRQGQ